MHSAVDDVKSIGTQLTRPNVAGLRNLWHTWQKMKTLKMTELTRFWPSVSTLPHCFSAWLCSLLSRFCRDVHADVGLGPHSLLLLGASCVVVLGAKVVLPLATSCLYTHRNSVAAAEKLNRVR